MNLTANDTQHFNVFGEAVMITTENPTLRQIIASEFSCYPAEKSESSWKLNLTDQLPQIEACSQNPKSHWEHKTGFQFCEKMCASRWAFNGTSAQQIDVKLQEFPGPLQIPYRWLHRQYTSRTEMLGQILHEAILVPRALIHPDRAVLHASAIIPEGSERPICIGGTGGSGKTSLMLKACLEHDWAFCADDISVLGTDGEMYPNFSYPKIYGYNLKSFPPIKAHLFHPSTLRNKLHWQLHAARGDDKVRRRIDPRLIFKLPDQSSLSSPSDYVILFREAVDTFSLEPISTALAASCSAAVLKTEYSTFLNHLNWSRFNQLLQQGTSDNEPEDPSAQWTSRIQRGLSSTRCWALRFPINATHQDFLDKAWPLLQGLHSDQNT